MTTDEWKRQLADSIRRQIRGYDYEILRLNERLASVISERDSLADTLIYAEESD